MAKRRSPVPTPPPGSRTRSVLHDPRRAARPVSGAQPAPAPETLPTRSNRWRVLVMIAVLLGCAWLRFYNLNWDGYQTFHPDERNIANSVVKIRLFYPPDQPRQLNPDFFAYGGLTIYIYRLGCEFMARALDDNVWISDWGHINLIGRIFAAFFSTITIIPLWFLARRAFGLLAPTAVTDGDETPEAKLRGTRIADYAAILFAFCVTSIQIAHFDITESLITLLITLIALVSLRLIERPSLKNYLLLGVLGGISLAAKMSALSFAVFPLVAHYITFLRAGAASRAERGDAPPATYESDYDDDDEYEDAEPLPSPSPIRAALPDYVPESPVPSLVPGAPSVPGRRASRADSFLTLSLRFFLCVFIAGTLFFAGSPYTFVDKENRLVIAQNFTPGAPTPAPDTPLAARILNPDLAGSMHYEGGVVSGAIPVPYTLQFDGTPSYYFWLYNLFWQMGPVALFCIAGTVWLLLAGIRRDDAPKLLLLSLLIVGFLYFGSLTIESVVIMRLLSIVRLLMLLGGVWLGAELVRRGDARKLLLLSFPFAYFLYVGGWHTKFIRYMMPLVPFLLLSGAWMLVELEARFKRWGRYLALASLGVTIWWAGAFNAVYRREQTRVSASKWIYAHVPVGSEIIREHWDDGLPINIPNAPPPNSYPNVKQGTEETGLRVYDDEDPPVEHDMANKAVYYARELSQADYIAINSRRLYGTLPRLVLKYPVTGRYYRLLFAGKLGYTRVADFASYPSLGLTIPDDASEETFQVYDHPKCIVFQNTGHLNSLELFKIINGDDPPTDSLAFPH